MINEKEYRLNLKEIEGTFKFSYSTLKHNCRDYWRFFPYVANEKTLFSNFDGVVGSLSRIMCNKEFKGNFNDDEFINNVFNNIVEFSSEESKEKLKDIIKTLFINNNNLIDFNIRTMNYIESTSAQEKIAKFLYSMFVDEELEAILSKLYDENLDNILYRLVLKSLPKLEEKEHKIDNYKCCLPFIKELFIKDLKFIASDENLYKSSFKRVLEYYYMFYISQLTIKLSKFEKANLNEPDNIYYTLSWESVSKHRTSYEYGWNLLKNTVDSIFPHSVTLELLNHHDMNDDLGYVELFNIFESSHNKEEIYNSIVNLCDEYKNHILDVDWDLFKQSNKQCSNKAFNEVYKLFEIIEYQFKNSTRSRAYEAFRNWYVKFVYSNFAKRRGGLGYTLSLTEEDIILITKICINNNEKLKLSVLFSEFEKRGILLDRDSKIKVIQLYEKLNLLEKKSDSGDAQYVRSIL